VLDQRPELRAIGRAAEEADRNPEAPFVAPAAAVRSPLVVVTERLLQPHRGIDARRVRAERALDEALADDAIDDDGVDVLASHEKIRRLRDRVAIGLGDEADAGHREIAPHDQRRERAGDDVHRAGGDEAAAQVGEQIAIAHLRDLRGGAEVDGAREDEVVGVGRKAVHQRGRDAAILLDLGVERRELLQVLGEDRRRRGDVGAKVDEPRFGRRRRPVVIDDGEHLEVLGVGDIGIDVVGVDERQKIHVADVLHRLDLLELDAEELHERAIFAVTEIVRVPDRGLGDAEARRDVGLRHGRSDAVGVGVPAKRDEHVLALRKGHHLAEGPRAIDGGGLRRGQSPCGIAHGDPKCGAFFDAPSRTSPLCKRTTGRLLVWKISYKQ
jgi:hypothetical protein